MNYFSQNIIAKVIKEDNATNPASTMSDCMNLVVWADKTITF